MPSAPVKAAAEPDEQYDRFSVPNSTSFTPLSGSMSSIPISNVTNGSEGGHVPSVFAVASDFNNGSEGGHVPSVFVQPFNNTVQFSVI